MEKTRVLEKDVTILSLLASHPQPGFVLTNKKTVLDLIKRGYLYHAQKVQDETREDRILWFSTTTSSGSPKKEKNT